MRARRLATVLVLCVSSVASQPGHGCVGGPCNRVNQTCNPGPFDAYGSPQFHVKDASCGENDPNMPFFDPLFHVYHAFWEAHLALDTGRGPVIGHAVSADMVHWAHMPVAIWNDEIWDSSAIFTGSATVVNGDPIIVYPGICTKSSWPACGSTSTVNAVALPANRSDPLLTNWTKPSYNPVIENAIKDVSTSWKTPDGNFSFTNAAGQVWASRDFMSFYLKFNESVPGWGGDCPDFFPLPRACTGVVGCGGNASFPLPSHVYKTSTGSRCGGADCYFLGVYEPTATSAKASWTPDAAAPRGQPLDFGTTGAIYASKSFESGDGRRIVWAWANVLPASVQSLPRELTWHGPLRRLLINPLPELTALRGTPLAAPGQVSLSEGGARNWLGNWPPGAGNQSEIFVNATLPNAAAVFGVSVLSGRNASGVNVSSVVSIAWDPTTRNCSVTVGGADKGDGAQMGNSPPYGPSTALLPLADDEAYVDIRIFIDHSIMEVFVGGGRLVFTVGTLPGASNTTAGVSLWTSTGSPSVDFSGVAVWPIQSIWVSAAEVVEAAEIRRKLQNH